jgi:hypothetical protein
MLKKFLASGAAIASLLIIVSPAQALVVRAWVSGRGNDVAGCGAPTNACRTLQYTHDNIVSAGGEIDILDPAGYGTLTITKAISVVNDGVGTAGVQANSGAAITINAGANDAIRLKGLNIEGLGTAANGVVFNSGASLTMEDCTVKDFILNQVRFAPTAPALIELLNSRFEHGGSNAVGILLHPAITSGSGVPTVLGTFDHIQVTGQNDGVFVDGSSSTSSVKTRVTLSNSLVSDNISAGVASAGAAANAAIIMVRNSTLSNNTGAAVEALTGGTIYVAHSTLSGNGNAFVIVGGQLDSYGDNNTDGNVMSGSTPTLVSLH